MARKNEIWPHVVVKSIAHKGMTVGKDAQGRVVFLNGAVPGDVVEARILRKRKGVWQGIAQHILTKSPARVEAPCQHFNDCGGCKWQDLAYEAQVKEKEQMVYDAMKRIAKVEIERYEPIVMAERIYHYRNKMEYSFSNQRWKTREEVESGATIPEENALGLHPPGFFNKVVDIKECWLQVEPANEIRNYVKNYARTNQLSFFDPVHHTGYLRNMILRNTTLDEWMLILSFNYMDEQIQSALLDDVKTRFPKISSLHYVINKKKNDTIHDQDIICYAGEDHITESIGPFRFKIRPKSFFQTNVYQARKLYELAAGFCEFKGDETVYDLYTGTGTIALFVAQHCRSVVGIEEVEDAIVDARENAQYNAVDTAHFYVGDVKKIFNDALFEEHGSPDIVITDPPRGGMDTRVIQAILEQQPEKIVYISCNPATQARDLALLGDHYRVDRIQPIDMFPHTNHVENIARLTRKA